MSKAVVHYFSNMGFGESIRHLLLRPGPPYKGIPLESRRYTLETWAEFKPNTPFGQLPVLEIDGKQYAQCTAICRYLGNKYGLAGNNDEEAFEIDQNVDFVNDILVKAEIAASYDGSDETVKENYFKQVHDLMDKLNTLIVQNRGFIALGTITWGDYLVADMLDHLMTKMNCPDLLEKYPVMSNSHMQIGYIMSESEDSE